MVHRAHYMILSAL